MVLQPKCQLNVCVFSSISLFICVIVASEYKRVLNDQLTILKSAVSLV